jgi:hypothetical protein
MVQLPLSWCWHPLTASHESSVQELESSQERGGAEAAQTPDKQLSGVHTLSSVSQPAELLECSQPLAGMQVSSVQGLESSQLGGVVPRHEPAEHVSIVVQALASSQEAALLECVHPEAGLQESSVQTLPSSQSGAKPPTQAPPAQVSLVVQALASSQEAALSACSQLPATQPSSVHGLLSSQSIVALHSGMAASTPAS